jgi:SAM-dependent methyltransferase
MHRIGMASGLAAMTSMGLPPRPGLRGALPLLRELWGRERGRGEGHAGGRPELLPPGGRILDVGCGSGRDSPAFQRRRFKVVPIDASGEMAKAAAILTGLEAKVVSFDEIGYAGEFYGIWACTSRLHAASQNLHRALDKLIRALKPNGVLYFSFNLSFKYGDAERIERQQILQ